LIFSSIVIGGKEYRLRYPSKVQIDISQNAGKILYNDPKMPVNILALADDQLNPLVQTYLLKKGLEWEHDISMEQAADLRDEFLSSGDADGGEKFEELSNAITNAIFAAFGMDPKKAVARMEEKRKTTEKERLKTAKAPHGTGTKPPDTA
jgi:hypothetical protein